MLIERFDSAYAVAKEVLGDAMQSITIDSDEGCFIQCRHHTAKQIEPEGHERLVAAGWSQLKPVDVWVLGG